MPRPIRCLVYPLAIAKNLAIAKKLNPMAMIYAVAKADAYGHGLKNVLTAFALADGLAVIEIEQAVLARQLGWHKPILLLEGAYDEEDMALVKEYDFSLVLHTEEQLPLLTLALHLFLKVNTGMNRLGFSPTRARELIPLLERNCQSLTLMTHYANADINSGIEDAFLELYALLNDSNLPLSTRNSAAVFRNFAPAVKLNEISRPGIMLYGSSPLAEQSARAIGLAPAMQLEAKIISMQSLPTGQAVGYGGTFVTTRYSRLATVACGYADGYPRSASNRSSVYLHGMKLPVVGRVSMDKLCIDVTDCPLAAVGDWVELWGVHMPVDEVAKAANTISYELLTAISSRVPKICQPGYNNGVFDLA